MQYISSYSTVLPVGLTADLTGVPQCPQADVRSGAREDRDTGGAEPVVSASEPDRTFPGRDGCRCDPRLRSRQDLSVRPVPWRPVIGRVDHERCGRPVRPRYRRRALRFAHRPLHRPGVDRPVGQSNRYRRSSTGSSPTSATSRSRIDRSDFTINPTAANARPISSTLTSSLGQAASTSAPLHAEACNELAFKPTFKTSTNGKTSRADGASLNVKLTMPIKLGTQVEHQDRQGRTAKATALPPGNAATGVHRKTVQREPRRPVRKLRSSGTPRDHADPARTLDGTDDLRQSRRRSVPQPDPRTTGLRLHDRHRRLHLTSASRGSPARTFKAIPDEPVGRLPAHDAPRQILGARRHREPLQAHARDPRHARRRSATSKGNDAAPRSRPASASPQSSSCRHCSSLRTARNQTEHTDQRHWLSEGEAGEEAQEGEGEAQEEVTAGCLSRPVPEPLRAPVPGSETEAASRLDAYFARRIGSSTVAPTVAHPEEVAA